MSLLIIILYILSFLGISKRKPQFFTLPVSQFRGFRTSFSKHSRWPNRSSSSKPKIDPLVTPFEGIKVENGPVHISNLWKPLGFTVLVSIFYCFVELDI